MNASNQDSDYAWVRDNNRFEADVVLTSADFAQIAIQGPRALSVARGLTDLHLDSMRYYWFGRGEFCGVPAMVARTGYTGEDGFEVYVPSSEAEGVWQAILAEGAKEGILPCGLGARNTLRLEAAMSLYGHEIDDALRPTRPDLAGSSNSENQRFEVAKHWYVRRLKGLVARLRGSRCGGGASHATATLS